MAALAAVALRSGFWATCRHCGTTIRHNPPHSHAWYDPDAPDFRAFYHDDCAKEVTALRDRRAGSPVTTLKPGA